MPMITIPFDPPLVPATFLSRPNRFVVRCRPNGRKSAVAAHLPDPGRLRELLIAGRKIWLRPAPKGKGLKRKTRWTAVLVQSPEDSGLVSLDTTLPNRLVRDALEQKAMSELHEWTLERAEAPVGRSRFDFLLARGGSKLLLEVKSVTLVENRLALFPDAVTARGTKHVRELAELSTGKEWAAAILFLLQRSDADRIRAAATIDPAFAAALEEARQAGVTVLGRRCTVSRHAVTLAGPVPVD